MELETAIVSRPDATTKTGPSLKDKSKAENKQTHKYVCP